jgi:hypothetical protein
MSMSTSMSMVLACPAAHTSLWLLALPQVPYVQDIFLDHLLKNDYRKLIHVYQTVKLA